MHDPACSVRNLSGPSVALVTLLLLPVGLSLAQTPLRELRLVPREIVLRRLQRFSRGNWTRQTELRKIFDEAGCGADRLSEPKATAEDPPNVACLLSGTTGSTIIVGAHSDVKGGGQGVLDDWSGAVLLPSLFQTLRDSSPKHTFVFVAFTAEEHHMRGSGFYVRQLSAIQVGRIRAMVNLECIGAGSTAVWIHHAEPTLLTTLYEVAREGYSPVRNVDFVSMYDDAMQFRKHRIPTLSFHSLTEDTVRLLHTRRDTLSVIDLNYYYASYRLIAAYLAHLDTALE
jgi:hypothetical protein